ncbi:Tex family protein [Thiohalorhabdus sp.]|uniref:Tex family protein n=1 Tax=Thiohalorhabdus sp. TaxID=3094134 RepID=UPI002FC2DB11
MAHTITGRIAEELGVTEDQVAATVRLLDNDATVPFIARYRKEATGALDDTQLRNLEERLRYLRELEERRETVLATIGEQGQLTEELAAAIRAAATKTRLEDLYAPYKPKRRTKGQKAIEAGLEPLARTLYDDPTQDPEALAGQFVDPEAGIADTRAALEGARAILMEEWAENPELVGELREYAWEHGALRSTVVDGKESEGTKFSDYFDYREPIKAIPSHRALALFRGRNEGILKLDLIVGDEERDPRAFGPGESHIAARFGIRATSPETREGSREPPTGPRPADPWLAEVVRFTWRVKVLTKLETELTGRLRERAEDEAIRVFAANIRDLLLAAPAGTRPVIGIDPGLRTGCKVAVVDATGKVVDTVTIYPHAPQKQWDQAIHTLAGLAKKHTAELVAIGNGTASRETDRLAIDLLKAHPELGLEKVMVSEAGASVYSASEQAANELPELDVSLRGAVSIARRLQDPLAELVKIEPKSIGVGQYQHDVSQTRLARTLDAVVEDAVNAVGVDANTASASLLTRVSGLNAGLAERLVAHRDEHGAFPDREALKAVPRLGAKTFEQAAGFLRIQGGDNPLDASAVHPEAYPVVERILADVGRPMEEVVANAELLRGLRPEAYTDDRFGVPTVTDILTELEKPGRDPRPEFETAHFREGVETLADLEPDMILDGVVTNVTNFGAFVDVGVHQDGLVHISQMADRYVADPREVTKPGDVVKVRVLEVDTERQRIGLSMKMQKEVGEGRAVPAPEAKATKAKKPKGKDRKGPDKGGKEPEGALAKAFRRARTNQDD